MAHDHPIIDVDKHFTIDPTTRKVLPDKPDKANLVQFDHNSERLTFELPRYIDGHDMLTCNEVWVHFNNIEVSTKLTNSGVYQVTDLQVSEEHEDTLVCSWLVSQEATQLVGLLSFVVSFVCAAQDGYVGYRWNSAPYTGISVLNGIFNSDIVLAEYADILVEWEERIRALEEGGGTGGGEGSDIDMEEVKAAINDALADAKASGDFDGEDGSVWWYIKQYIDGTSLDMVSDDAKNGDYCLHVTEGHVYYAKDDKWKLIGNIKGAPGINGSDGVSISKVEQTTTSSVDGGTNVITVTLSDGKTFTFNVKNGSKGSVGATGATGATGSAGKDGTSVTVVSVSESTADGGSNVVTFSDGKSVTIKNGSKGSAGAAGSNGKDGSNGADGIGIKSVVQTTTSNADDGSNEITVTKTDGSESKFTVKNGSKGSKGDKGDKPVKGTDYFTEADKQEIVGEVTASLDGIPDGWGTALDAGAKATNIAIETAGRNKSSFLFYTDAHWGYNYGTSPALLKYLGKHTAINKTIFGGDFGNTYDPSDTDKTMEEWMDIMREWKLAVRDIPNHHSVVGNHDRGDGENIPAIDTDKELYGFLFAPEETNDIVRGGDFFYYIDDVNERTRYLYMDTGLCENWFSDEQCKFFIEALKTTPVGWHIVAASHIWFVYASTSTPTVGSVPANIQKVLKLFDDYNARATGSVTIKSESNAYDFSDCGAKVEFCIGGHTHVDYVFASDNGIPVILCRTDSRHLRGDDSIDPTEETTKSAVSAIVADYDNENIAVIRVGRGSSFVVDITNPTQEVRYTIATNLTNVASSSNVVQIREGESYSTTLTPTLGEITSVTVIMGGTDITNSAYTSSTGVISIPSVTGDVVITAVADVVAPSYTNVLDTVGYEVGRLNSSGQFKTDRTDRKTTGFIEAPTGATVYFKNVTTKNSDYGRQVAFYDSSQTFITGKSYLIADTSPNATWYDDGSLKSFTIGESGVGWVRFCFVDINDTSIITVNEPIE